MLAHRGCLRELPHPDQPAPAAAQQDTTAEQDTTTDNTTADNTTAENTEDTVTPVRELRIVTRTRERYQAITALHTKGASIAAIARTLDLDRHTVRRFVRAPPASRSCRPRPCSGPACSTDTPTTYTSAGPRVAPTPPP